MEQRNRYFTFLMVLALLMQYYPSKGQIRTASGRGVSIAEMDSLLMAQMDSLQMPGVSIK